MTVCRTCLLPWDHMNSHFTVCPSCRANMPVRRVNTKTDKPWKPLPEISGYGWAQGDSFIKWAGDRLRKNSDQP